MSVTELKRNSGAYHMTSRAYLQWVLRDLLLHNRVMAFTARPTHGGGDGGAEAEGGAEGWRDGRQ